MELSDWPEINKWRKAKREDLLSSRLARPLPERKRVRDTVVGVIIRELPGLQNADLGFYWPFRGELDLRDLAASLTSGGNQAALPVIVEQKRPVEFWAWAPGAKTVPGVWNIPIPADCNKVIPSALLIPLLGYDEDGYRLGYGGGYYDRTLAALTDRPFAIGVGFARDRVPTIHPQPHDIPMDAIVTEEGIRWYGRRDPQPWKEPRHAVAVGRTEVSSSP